MGEGEISSGRERTFKKALAKESNLEVGKRKRDPGTWSDVKALVQEAECTGRTAHWRTAALAKACFFECRRMGYVVRVRVCNLG
jgi:hypothetical protein